MEDIEFRVVWLQTGKIDAHKEAMRLLYNNACGVTSLNGYKFLQFSGILDKKGKKIFEGDKLRDTLTKMESVVRFGACKKFAFYGWYLENEEFDFVSKLNGDQGINKNTYLQIIGSIY